MIEAKNGQIVLSATDLYTGIRSIVMGVVDQEGSAAVPAQALTEVITSMSPGNIDFEVNQGVLHINGKGVFIKIQTFSGEDYPTFPDKQGETVSIKKEDFEKIVEFVTFATAKDDSRPILTSVLFNFSEDLEIVATDGFRLATLNLVDKFPEQRLLVPVKAVHEIARLQAKIKAEVIDFTISEQMKQVFCNFASTELVIRLMEGEFPPYQKIIPADFTTSLTFDREDLIQALKGAMVFAREASNIVKFQIEDDQMTIVATSPTLGTHTSNVSITKKIGEKMQIAFNALYLMEFLSSVKDSQIWLGLNDSLQPAMFRPDQMLNYRYIVMPFRVND
jgi:DNA polymerase-3 subunit beta